VQCWIFVVSRMYYNHGIYILSKLKKERSRLRHELSKFRECTMVPLV